MKLKYFSIFIFLFLLICSANAIYAASDDNILELDQSGDIVSMDDNVAIPVLGDDPANPNDPNTNPDNPNTNPDNPNTNPDNPNTNPDNPDDPNPNTNPDDPGTGGTDNPSTGGTNTGNSSSSSSSSSSKTTTKSNVTNVSSYSGLVKALNNKKKNIALTANIKISKTIVIKYNVVIDGKGHTIDAQKKTRVFKISSATVTLKNLKIKKAKSDKGAAVYGYKTTLTLKKCTFTSNTATQNGGAVYIYVGKLTVGGSTFKYNVAYNGGGAIYVSTTKLIIKKSTFEKNKVQRSKKSGHGGAVYVCKKTSSIENSTFKTNTCLSKACKSHGKATKYQFSGGAIYVSGGTSHNLTKCKLISSKATNHGGALYYYQPASVILNKCTFKYNKVVYEDGAAISSNAKKLVIKNSYFYKNHAYEDGGVMDSLSLNKNKAYITVTGCNFKANTAYKGAGTFWMGKKTVFTFKNNNFTSNKAGMGGALFAEATTAKITNCIFQGNQAKNLPSWKVRNKAGKILKHYGGALMVQKYTVTITKCVFKKNSAAGGGAICKMGGKLKISGTKFSGNTAKSGPKIKKI